MSLYRVTNAILYPLLVVVSLVTIAAITVDRYPAFVLHLRYATTITVSRVIKLICYFLVFVFHVRFTSGFLP